MTEQTVEDTATLPEQRYRVNVQSRRQGVTHVVRYSTFPAALYPGRWTRMACDRRTVCGSMTAVVIGVDAADWATEPVRDIDTSTVTCKRCRERYNRD